MAIETLLARLEALPLSVAIAGGTDWPMLFPAIEAVHVVALSLVFGSIALLDLRLLGLASRDARASTLAGELLPVTWSAFALAAASGSLMFISKATTYYGDLHFRLKFLLLALAGLNMLVFHLGAFRRVAAWDAQLPPPPSARFAGAASLLLWTGVVFMGRYVGFST